MDINCTHNCVYQKEGKCNLSSSLTLNNISNSENSNSDCPYYISYEDYNKNNNNHSFNAR
ncbi:MAG: hypothetical protein N4A50_12490 [Vallitalea sp.]|jgi:hypothetical protein|nr:hypothetical protein [Vallitalea sp.]